jgi:hypothetical protein
VLVLLTIAIIATPSVPSRAARGSHEGGGRGSAHVIRIHDPSDVEACDTAPDCPEDIRYLSLRSYIGGAGRSMLAITVGAYELYGGLVFVDNIKVRFDASGDPLPDGKIFLSVDNLPFDIGWQCGPRVGTHPYRLRIHADALTCFIPEEDLHPTKPIRLFALSRGNRFIVDRAPDQGWGG